jgi:fructokinase
MTSFLVAGESLVDLISEPGSWRFEAAPGGSPLNVAVGLAAAGHPVRLASEVGDDLFGGLVRDHLARYRVDLGDLVTTDAPTSLAFARLDEAGVAGYDFRLGWRWRGRPELAGVDCLHVGSLGAVLSPGAAAVREAVAAARRRGIPVSYDPNVRPALMDDATKPTASLASLDRSDATRTIEELVGEADLVKVSHDDLAWLYPGTPDQAAAAGWLDRGPRLVVVTRGGDGAIAVSRKHSVECPAPRVDVVDTVGAGDAFTAGLLSRLTITDLSGPGIAAALRHATALAAAVCAQRGAAPPPPDVVDRLLAELTP